MAQDAQHILKLIDEYLQEKAASKTWVAGKDMVHYAGPFMDSEETVRAVNTLLKGWLVMGDDCLRFEKVFPRQFGLEHGILTNSGSSANLLMMASLTSKRG